MVLPLGSLAKITVYVFGYAEGGPGSNAADAAAGNPRFGNSGRSVIDGPGITDVDFGLFKDIHFGEQTKLQFRGKFFNAFNHANFGDPVMNLSAGNYSQLVSAGEPRDIQLSLKLVW